MIVGHNDHRVVFPPWETAGTFTVDVYTTSQLVAFRVQRSDGDPQEQQMLTEFVSYPSNSIVAKYRVGIPWISEKLNGIYTISVTNRDGESATQTVRIEKAAGGYGIVRFDLIIMHTIYYGDTLLLICEAL